MNKTKFSANPESLLSGGTDLLLDSLNIDSNDNISDVMVVNGATFSERIIQMLNKHFGRQNQEFVDRDHLVDLLHSNNIHYRSCQRLPYNRRSEQDCFYCVKKSDNKGYLLLSRSDGYFAYCPESNSSAKIKGKDIDDIFQDYGYELYPVLPPGETSFKSLFLFSFNAIKIDAFKAFSISIALTLFGMLSPLITSHVVGDVVPSGDIAWILSTFIISMILALYSALISWLQSYYQIRVSQKLSRRLEMALYKRLLGYPLDFVDKYTTGDLSSRVSSLSTIISRLSTVSFTLIIQFLSLFAFLSMMIYFDAQLAVAGVCVVLVATAVDITLVRKQLIYQKQNTELSAKLYNDTLQTLSAISQIRTNSAEPHMLRKWYKSVLKISNMSYESARLSDYNSAISSLVAILGSSVIYAVLVVQLLHANNSQAAIATAGSFIIFTSAYSSFSSSFRSIVGFFNTIFGSLLIDWQRGMPMLRQVEEQALQTDSNRSSIDLPIAFKNITFTYPGSDSPVLNNVGFEILPGKFNVIFGPSGCGKSTILSLLLSFYRPDSGSILLGDVPIINLDLSHYRQQIGVVLQNSSVPPVSIRDSLTGGLYVDDQRIWSVLKLVNLSDEISQFPMKLETILSEGASNISGGQRQRLCIARALLRNPTLLIEDEATSALDNKSQSIIVRNLRHLNITRLVVAHRLTAIRGCDHLIILNDQGQVEATGDYQYCIENSSYLQSIVDS